MNTLNRYSLFVLMVLAGFHGFAQRGKDGVRIVTSASFAPNEYTALTADAATGDALIKVVNSTLNGKSFFSGPLAAGDLLMIIQMQGATIKGGVSDSTWGTILSYNNCGLYEFSEVLDVPDLTTIRLQCGLKNNYSQSGKTQVIRVPRYSNMTINTACVLTADAWDGTKGGVVVVEVQNNTVINNGGMIDATGKGFRGGALNRATGGSNFNFGFFSTTLNQGGEKGESIAGYRSDYNAAGGMYQRGAPANGGGGGNTWNSPGGGGGNAGNINAYTGNGNPDTTTNVNYITAWNLEYNGFANSTSSGGGRGGYSVGFSGNNPLVTGPNNPAWSIYQRSNTGGKGGRPLDYSTGRIFLGGGGGASHQDDNHGGAGGNGGGMVYLISYGTVSGTGQIVANGNKGGDAVSPTSQNGDPPGGGGGGGTILIYSTGAISGISVSANGGNGGSQYINKPDGESEGPGGGGGGGYIALSNGTVSRQAKGGLNGTTNSLPMVNFPPDGATKGGIGLPDEILTSVPFSFSGAVAGTVAALPDTVCSGASAQLNVSGNTGAIQWQSSIDSIHFNDIPGASAPTYQTPGLAVTSYYRVKTSGSCGEDSSAVQTVYVLPLTQAGSLMALDDSVCTGDSSTIYLQGSDGNIQWQLSVNGISYSDIAQAQSDSIRVSNLLQTTYFRATVGGVCNVDTSAEHLITVVPLPVANLVSSDTVFCSGDSVQICATGALAYLWNTADTSSCIYSKNAGAYWVTATGVLGCSTVSVRVNLQTHPIPPVSIVVQGDTLSSFNAVSYQWYYEDVPITGAVSAVYIAKEPGQYSLRITDQNGCSATSTPVVITGWHEILEEMVNIYPNPNTASSWQLMVSDGLVESKLEVIDNNGRLIFNSKINNQNFVFELPVSFGVYFLYIYSDKINLVKKLIRL